MTNGISYSRRHLWRQSFELTAIHTRTQAMCALGVFVTLEATRDELRPLAENWRRRCQPSFFLPKGWRLQVGDLSEPEQIPCPEQDPEPTP